jgi:putative endonuclease
MAAHNDFGAHAERMAAALLERNGWTILHRNWRFGRREIDVIARLGSTVAFVEVKAGGGVRHGHPLERIDWRKRRDLAIAAAGWIERHGRAGDEYRFDAVHIVARQAPGRGTPDVSDVAMEVEHTENAWCM